MSAPQRPSPEAALREAESGSASGGGDRGETLRAFAYKGYIIRPRTFQIRGSARWTLDLLIDHQGQLRAFSAPTTYPTEARAETACLDYGRHIIDGDVQGCTVTDL